MTKTKPNNTATATPEGQVMPDQVAHAPEPEAEVPAQPTIEQLQEVNKMLNEELQKTKEELFDQRVECSVLKSRISEVEDNLIEVSKKATKLNLQLNAVYEQANK